MTKRVGWLPRLLCIAGAVIGGAAAAGDAQRPTARTIAYTASGGGTSHLWMMNVDTRVKRQLTRGRFGEETPSWSPSGKQLAYAEYRRVRVPGLPDGQIMPAIVIRDMTRGTIRAVTTGRYFDETQPGHRRATGSRSLAPRSPWGRRPPIRRSGRPDQTGAERAS